jgi:hypothetical protein
MWSVPSAIEVRGKFTDGASRWMICDVSVRPVFSITAAVITSTGTGEEVTVRSARRLPTATIGSSASAEGESWKFSVTTPPAGTLTERVTGA